MDSLKCMKRILLSILSFVLISTSALAGDFGKSGFSILPSPCLGYSTNHGTQYGANVTIIDFGDGSYYPNYKQKIYLEATKYTKGKSSLKAVYDSGMLIPDFRFSAIIAYQSNPLYRFYGFNGSATPYDPSIDLKNDMAYYNFGRSIFKAAANIQHKITDGLNWVAGVNFVRYGIATVSDKFTSDPSNSLYHIYKEAGIIRANEAEGGQRLEFNTGIVFDTRNEFTAPSSGIWSELYLTGSPDVFNDSYRYLKLSAHFRHYLSLLDEERLIFAYHLAYQGTIAGEAPFYVQQSINELIYKKTVSEGLGSKNTIRGTLNNRFVGDSYAWANIELRIKLFSFNAFKQSFYVATNPFIDLGAIVKPFRLNAERGSELYKTATRFHESVGIGAKLVMSRNFVASAEVAKPLHKDDGKLGFIMGMNYMF